MFMGKSTISFTPEVVEREGWRWEEGEGTGGMEGRRGMEGKGGERKDGGEG